MSQKRKPEDSEQNEVIEAEVKKGKLSTASDIAGPSSACPLDLETQDLIEFIFDDDMFKEIVENFDFDVKKIPLNEIRIPLIDKAFGPLEKLEKAIKDKELEEVDEQSSNFLCIIPHRTTPVLRTVKSVQNEFDLLNILADIEIAQKIKKDLKDAQKPNNTLDIQYGSLNSELKLMDTSYKEYKAIMKYIKARRGNLWRGAELANIWTVRRQEQDSGFAKRTGFQNRRLLWYCPNVASTVVILKTGLHVKPHQGHGIHFHDAVNITAVSAQGKGILFLCEVALGNPFRYTGFDLQKWSSPPDPEYHDSIFGVGHWGPDEKSHGTIQLDGNDVAVPFGKVKRQCHDSGFLTSEYVIFNEDRYCIRYILLFDNV